MGIESLDRGFEIPIESLVGYWLEFNSQNRRKLFFYWEFVWVMNYSRVHMITQVIDEQSLSLNRHMAWCECHEIWIQRSFNILFLTHLCQLPLYSISQPVFRKSKYSFTKCQSFWKVEVNNPSFNEKWLDLAVSSQHLLRLFAILSIQLFFSVSRIHSFTMPAVNLSICQSKTRLQKAFSLHAGALSLWHSLPQ